MHWYMTLRYRLESPKQLSFCDATERFAGAEGEYILNYSSNVLKLLTPGGQTFFFKEASPRPASLRDCVENGVELFFREIRGNPALREKVLRSLRQKKNLRRLAAMGEKNRPGDGLHRYLTDGDERVLGLPLHTDPAEAQQLRRLIFYLYGEIRTWFYNAGLKTGEKQTFSARRSLGTYALAKLLGVERLLPRCEFVKLTLHGREQFGVLSEEAPGDTLAFRPYGERAAAVTPALLRDLTDLNLLDVLSGENDHRVGNYHVSTDENGKYISVCSYDNDSPDVFGLSADIRFENLVSCSPFVDGKGRINRAHLNRSTAERLLQLKKRDLEALRPYLSALQMQFLWKRVEKLQKAVTKTLLLREDLLLADGEWSMAHLRQDLSAPYGKTYLASLLSDGYFETGLHPFDTL